MTVAPGEPPGSIYDLGYRHYEAARLGRPHAVAALYRDSFRATFGLGRRLSSKVFPMGLALILLLPALLQLGIVAAVHRDIEVIRPENYFNLTQVVVFLFCAAVAPELVGRDQRNGSLSLYFSRALLRRDYAAAKLIALWSALFLVVVAPQALLLAGSALAADDSFGYLRERWHDVPAVLATALVSAGFMAATTLAIASQTPRRTYSTGAVLAFFVALTVIGGILYQTLSGEWKRYSVLLNTLADLDGFTLWVFGAPPRNGSEIAFADFPGPVYLLVLLAATGLALVVFFRRYQRIPA